jgi:molecular chaperone DnaJ
MLGGKLTVQTLDGEREVDVPAGAQPGERIVLRGLGLPSLRGAARGDQHVLLKIKVPEKLNKEQRRIAEQLDDSLA